MTRTLGLAERCVRPVVASTALALLGGAALAAAPPPAEPDPLALEAEPAPPNPPGGGGGGTKFFVEGAAGRASQRYGLGDRTVSRGSVDLRHAQRLSPALQATVSVRLDATQPQDERIGGTVLSLREAYGGWQNNEATQLLEIGRINLREGPAYGYNPTDYFRGNALRTITSANPATLRENRLGTVMLRGQALWSKASMALVYAPELEDAASTKGLSADLGATNDRQRALLTLNNRWSESVNTQLSFYKQAGLDWQTGASGSALLSDALVAHGEWSSGVAPRAGETEMKRRQRAAIGATYTTAGRLSVTAEWQYNGTAADRATYLTWRQQSPQLLPAYQLQSVALQDNASRQAWFFYVTQRDLGLKNLDLTALAKLNRSDNSRLAWLELRYRMSDVDLSLQLQHTDGEAGSEFGTAPLRNTAVAVLTVYF